MKGWLDNFGKADNANDSNVSLSEDFVGLGYNTKGRNYSPAWGGQFEDGGIIPIAQKGIQRDATRVENNAADRIWGIQRQIDSEKLNSDEFREKYGMPLHQFKMRDSNYASAFQRQIEQRRQQDPNYAEVNLPSTDIRSSVYQGNPNLAFLPGTSEGQSRAALEDAFLATTTLSAPLLPVNTAKIGQASKLVGNYLTTKTPLRNAYKLNPRAFKPNQEAYYHRSPNLENIVNQEAGTLQGFGQSEAGKTYSELAKPGMGNTLLSDGRVSKLNLRKPANSSLYFSKGVPLDYGRYNPETFNVAGKRIMTGQGYTGPYLVEVKGVPMGASTKGRLPGADPIGLESYAISRRPISLDEAKFYKEDWLKGYKQIDIPKKEQGGSIPGSVGFIYARTAGSAPSEGPYAKKTMPSAQNGQEMKFYQEGLDWKPKSMQYGGSEKISTSDPRYPELYKNRQVGAYYDGAFTLPDLDQVTVTAPRSYTMQSLRDATTAAMYGAPANAMKLSSVPQAAMTEGIEMLRGRPYDFGNVNPNFGGFSSNQRDPSMTMGYENPEGFLQNAANIGLSMIDPGIVTGGLGKGSTTASKSILGRLFASHDPRNLKSQSGLDWSKRWYESPEIIDRKIAMAYGDPSDEFLRSHAEKASNDFVEYVKENLNQYQPKTYIDLLKDKGLKEYLNYGLTSGGLSYGRPDQIYVNRGAYFPFDKQGLESVRVHELSHLANYNGFNLHAAEKSQLLKPFGFADSRERFEKIQEILSKRKRKDTSYYTEPTEIKARMDQARFDLNLSPSDKFTPEMFDRISKEKDWYGMNKYINDKDAFVKLMNKFWAAPAAGVVVGSQALDQKRDGGIVKDNQGYWNPDNWGKPVEIGSNNITMQGVNQPLIGISDAGDVQYMTPGNDYKFKGSKVTEIPVAQKGVTTPAQQEVSRQDYLSKFKMYDDVLKSKNYTTPYYKDNNIDTSDGGMNCINGVCYMVSNIAGVKFDKGQTKDTYTGNATFADNAMDEGYYRSDPEKEGFGVGDIFQYSRKKSRIRSRFPGEVNFRNENDLYPNHAVLIVDQYDKNGQKYFKIANNSGGDKVEYQDVSESELMDRYKKGYDTFDGGITYRYDPDRVMSIRKENTDRTNVFKGKNPYAEQYSKFDTSNLAFFNNRVDGLNVTNELAADKNLQRYADVYKTVYSDIGKGSNMPIDSFNKLIMNQVGIAGQETKFGELASNSKDFVPDVALPYARRAREIYSDVSGTLDNWKQAYWEDNADNVQKEFSSYEDFVKSFKSEDSDYNPYRTPRSIGEFQQKDLSERGNFYGYDLDSFEGQVKSSLALAVDNYHKLKAKYPDLSEDQIIDLTTLMHNAPGKALEPRFVNHYLKRNDVDYVNKVKGFAPKSFGKNQPANKKTEEVKFEPIAPEKAKSIANYLNSLPKKRNGGGVGINQLDAQPKKKLNQLLNFTNNPDKTNWLDKYQ